MRALFVSDVHTRGGAGIAASRIARGLSEIGVSVHRVFAVPSTETYLEPVSWTSESLVPERPVEVLVNGLRRLGPTAGRRVARALVTRRLDQVIASERWDVLHVHAIHNSAIDHDVLARIDPALPTVWTFHDHWGFSPESYLLEVNGKPLRVKPDGPDREAAQARRRRYFDSRLRLHLAGNSDDTSAYARRLLDRDVETIHYGVPLDLHRPVDRASARRALQLPQDDFVVGFSADVTADPVKGFDVLEAALRALRGSGVRGVAMGTGAHGDRDVGGVPVHVLGRIDNPVLQSIVYSAADLFVVPSRVEALGQVAMESIACGTPVVASNVGGLPDVVREGETGWLFPPGDAAALTDALRRAREDARAGTMRAHCREHAEREWPLAKPAHRYRDVYERLAR